MLDFVNPVRAGRRSVGWGREAGFDEAGTRRRRSYVRHDGQKSSGSRDVIRPRKRPGFGPSRLETGGQAAAAAVGGPLVPDDLLTDTERALDAFARLARAMARNEADAPWIAELPQLGGQLG